MAIYKSYNDIVLSFLEYLRLAQPEMDTKPGTVARDLFVDAPAQPISDLYAQLKSIASLSSLFSVFGTDLTKLASNFGISRKSGRAAAGVAVFTTNSLDSDVFIPSGTVVVSKNGVNYKTISNTLMSAVSSNVYMATASRLRTELDLASITDQYAVEINVEAFTSGTSGNIGPYSITSHNISGISNVTNLQTFSGGTNPESDSELKSRILSVFSGSNTGTELGYSSAVESVSGISDSIVIVPGDPFMTRDGTSVSIASDGTRTVLEEGTGGKVDIYVLGSDQEEQIDTFIYNDKSGKRDATDPDNDVILGQRGQTTGTNTAQRRVSLIAANTIPYQPVTDVISVVGSSSGANFVKKYTDDDGVVKGNYDLILDSGSFGGSCFGYDKIRWISNEIDLLSEDITKGGFNGSDELEFSDVNKINKIIQEIYVTNENSISSSTNRSEIRLRHSPVKTVSRVVNATTGERYVIVNQNPYGETGELNTSARITISGSTLPVGTDVLQVDYTWVKEFDGTFDYDNLLDVNTNRSAQDSVDWSYSNIVKNEPSFVYGDGYGNFYVDVSHHIYKVFSANTFSTSYAYVSNGSVSADNYVLNVIDIKRVSDGVELYNTDALDGELTGTAAITLPTDSLAEDGDYVVIRYNANDAFVYNEISGSFQQGTISFPDGASVSEGDPILINYVSNINVLVPETNIADIPVERDVDSFVVGGIAVGDQPTSNKYNNDGTISNNLRRTPSNIKISVSSIPSAGSFVVFGRTIKKISNAICTVISGSGYEIDLSEAIIDDLSVSSVPSTVGIAKINKIERVNLLSSGLVSSVDNEYDIINYKINDNFFDVDCSIKDTSVGKSKVVLQQTDNNVENILSVGDSVRVTFYYYVDDDSEVIYFSKNGELITDKKFFYIDKIYSNYGFKNTSGVTSGTFTVSSFTQPIESSSYFVDYSYVAPKENERITINYNYNSLISVATNAIEEVRPITADVLVKSAIEKKIDVVAYIVLLPEYVSQSQIIVQDAVDSITSFLSANSLGTTIDSSDIVDRLYSVNGIDRVRIVSFSSGDSGNVLSISANKNEYLSSGTISITVETR